MKIFPASNLVISEFEKIKKLAEEECMSEPGRQMIMNATCFTDFNQVELLLQQAQEFKKIAENGEPFPYDSFVDITKDLQMLGIQNSVLAADSFLKLLDFSRGVKDVFAFFEKRKSLYPVFSEMSAN